ncbi:MAG: hypothetical protein LBQ61_08485 [Spirochaetales bacterium]|nr:hypothetical protein [Spirochaetales bacterium]
MVKNKPRRLLLLVMLGGLILASVSSEALLHAHWEHDCIGEGCPICALLNGARNFLKALWAAALLALFPGLRVKTRLGALRFGPSPSLSLFFLKVRLNC